MVIFLASTVLLAGCLDGGSEEPEEPAVTITDSGGLTLSFSAPKRTYAQNEQVILELNVQNTGQSTATNIDAQLFGPSFLTGDASIGTLAGVDEAAQQPGEQASHVFREDHGVSLVTGATEDFSAGVQVQYTYSTTATASFTVVPRDKFSGSSSQVKTDNTAAPVHATIDISSPKPVYGSGARRTVSVPVVVQNVGGGEVSSLSSFDLTLPNAGSGVSVEGCNTGDGAVPLFDGRRRIVCDISLPADQVVQETQFRLQAYMEYTYTDTARAPFTIEGVTGGETPGDGGDGGDGDGASLVTYETKVHESSGRKWVEVDFNGSVVEDSVESTDFGLNVQGLSIDDQVGIVQQSGGIVKMYYVNEGGVDPDSVGVLTTSDIEFQNGYVMDGQKCTVPFNVDEWACNAPRIPDIPR